MSPVAPDGDPGAETPVILRPAREDDVMTLAFLELELFPEEAWTVFQLAEEIAHPDRRYVVAEQAPAGGGDPEILGYAGIMVAGDLADIHTIGTVRPGQGIGRRLLSWLEDAAAAAGARSVLLDVREDNDRARAFYAAAGYAPIDRRRGYYRSAGGAVDAIVMQRELPAR